MAASTRCVVFTAAPIGGSGARSAAPGALAARWQADAMLHPSPPGSHRVRQLIQASLGAALNKVGQGKETCTVLMTYQAWVEVFVVAPIDCGGGRRRVAQRSP
jgi:hypothetical protein